MAVQHHLPRIYYLLMAFVLSLGVFYMYYRADVLSEHNATMAVLSRLNQLNSGLDEQVLLLYAYRLNHFDQIVTTRDEIIQLNRTLHDELLDSYGPSFALAAQRYLESSSTKLDQLERFKSLAALSGTSLRDLPYAAIDFSDGLGDPRGQSLMALVAELFSYSLFHDEEVHTRIEERITTLRLGQWEEAERQSLDDILRHSRTALRQRDDLIKALNSYLSLNTGDTIDRLTEAYLGHHAGTTRNSQRLATILLVVTLLLFIGLALTLRSLQKARQGIEQTWEQLSDAIESIGEGFALYDAHDRLLLWNSNFTQVYPDSLHFPPEGIRYRELLDRDLHSGLYRPDISPEAWIELHLRRDGHPLLDQLRDGRTFQVSNYSTTEGGRVTVMSDITARLDVETELRKLSRAVEQSPVSVMITDTDGRIEYVNEKFTEVTGYAEEEVLGRNPRVLQSGDTPRDQFRQMWQALTHEGEWRGQFHNRRKNGELFWESASISAIRDAHGQITHYLAVKEDITERKRAEEELHLAAVVFETSSEGIMVTDAGNRIITVNPAFTRITGYAAEEVIGHHPSLLKSGRQDEGFYSEMWQNLEAGQRWEGEIWNRRKNGELFPEWLSVASVRDGEGQVRHHVAVFSDITKRKEDEEKILWQANFDPLTHLPNRTLFGDRLEQALAGSRREHWICALLFVDLDRFKAVNDTFGHPVGDQLLVQVSTRLRETVRESDTVARLGGDEFTVILQDVSGDAAVALVAEKIIQRLSEPFEIAGNEIFIGATLGIAVYPGDADDAGGMLRNADLAMYQAKQEGRNRYHFYTESMNQQALRRNRLEADLHRALERNELEVWYQPIVRADDLGLHGAEALLRWHHPENGLLMPGEFIPLAEESGMIGVIGEWVLEQACRQASHWQQAYDQHLRISVNLSTQQRRQGLDGARLAELLTRSGEGASLVNLELTEGMLLEQSEENIRWLESFKALGVSLSIDDFGTGYSSLSYLRRFPFDSLKIDKSFVTELSPTSGDAALVQAIIALAESFDLTVVAEGVERQEQLDYLRELGCDLIQGYLISQPLPPREFTARFIAHTAP